MGAAAWHDSCHAKERMGGTTCGFSLPISFIGVCCHDLDEEASAGAGARGTGTPRAGLKFCTMGAACPTPSSRIALERGSGWLRQLRGQPLPAHNARHLASGWRGATR